MLRWFLIEILEQVHEYVTNSVKTRNTEVLRALQENQVEMHYIERITWAKTFPLGDSWGGRASQQSPLPLVSCSCHTPKKPPHDGADKALPQHPSNREYVWKVEKQLAEIPADTLTLRAALLPTHGQKEIREGSRISRPWHLPGWQGRQQTPQKSFRLLMTFRGQTFSTTISVTLKLSALCVWVRSHLILSQQGRELFKHFFFFSGEKKKNKTKSPQIRSTLSACQQLHVLLRVCKYFSSRRMLRNAFCSVLWRHPGTPEVAGGLGLEEVLAHL